METRVLVLLVLLVFVGATMSDLSSLHNIQKRQIVRRGTISVKPVTGCVFYQCIADCKRRGYKGGGYCTINGCQCVR